MTATTQRSFPRHTHDQYGVGIVDSGIHASLSESGQVEAFPGSFITVNPGELHDGRAVEERSRTWRILYFDPKYLNETRAETLERASSSLLFTAPVFDDEPLRRLFNDAFTVLTSKFHDTMLVETALLRFVARLDNHSSTSRRRDGKLCASIRRARDRIVADPSKPLTLAELAEDSNISRYQLIRGFARELGLTPHAYILQKRLALARRLIRARRPLVEVAVASGFYDQAHLTRCFVRQFGVTPSRYAASNP
jgi:AraC-like DNA-binding protein